MPSNSQRRAIEAHRRRLAERGLDRFEVRGLEADKQLIRDIARRLAANDEAARALRADLTQQLTDGEPLQVGGILAALRRSPLVGSNLELAHKETPGRTRPVIARYLLDTNVITEVVKPSPSEVLLEWLAAQPDDALHISALTVAEVRRCILSRGTGAAPARVRGVVRGTRRTSGPVRRPRARIRRTGRAGVGEADGGRNGRRTAQQRKEYDRCCDRGRARIDGRDLEREALPKHGCPVDQSLPAAAWPWRSECLTAA